MINFENLMNRLCKLQSLITELNETLLTLKGEALHLQSVLFGELSQNTKLYNICRQKNMSMGRIGKNLFTAAFGQCVKLKPVKGRTEQDLLQQVCIASSYAESRYVLLKDRVKADLRTGKLSTAELKALGLMLEPTANLTVRKFRTDSELTALAEEARTLADSIEED